MLSRNQDRNIMCKQYLEQKLSSELSRFIKKTNGSRDSPPNFILDVSQHSGEMYRFGGADSWVKVTDSDFVVINDVLRNIVPLIVPQYPNDIDIVDYGCGDGKKGILIHKLLKLGADSWLRFIDYSEEILAIAKENASMEKIGCTLDRCDLSDAPHSLESKLSRNERNNRRFHLFLGQTIGNFDHPEDLLSGISSTMKPDEFLLVEWFKADDSDHYNDELSQQFVLGYLKRMGFSEADFLKEDGKLDYFVKYEESGKDKGRFKMCVRLHKQKSIHILDPSPQYEAHVSQIQSHVMVNLSPGTVIIASYSIRFKEEEVLNLLKDVGLEIKEVYQFEEKVLEEWSKDGEGWIVNKPKNKVKKKAFALAKKIPKKSEYTLEDLKQAKSSGFVKGVSITLGSLITVGIIGILGHLADDGYLKSKEIGKTEGKISQSENYTGKILILSAEEAQLQLKKSLNECNASIYPEGVINISNSYAFDYSFARGRSIGKDSYLISNISQVSMSSSASYIQIVVSKGSLKEEPVIQCPQATDEQKEHIVDLLYTIIQRNSTDSQGYSE